MENSLTRHTSKVSLVPATGMDADHRRNSRFWIMAATGLAGLLVAPLLLGSYPISLLTEVLILALLASGLNLLVGYTGLVSLGHAAFLGVGAYITAIATVLLGYPVWIGMIGAMLASLIIACLIGILSVRTRGVQFLLITLAFGQLLHAIAEKSRMTGGDDGMTGIPRLDLSLLGLNTHSDHTFYLTVLAFFVVTLIALRMVVESPFGRTLAGIRENEKRIMAIGYNPTPYKALAFAISGLVAGLAGSLWAQHAYFVNPHIMSWQMSGEVLFIVIIGGSQAFFGPLLGAAFYVLLKSFLSTLTDSYMMIFGIMFVLVVAFFKGGIAGFLGMLSTRLQTLLKRGRA
ncbi:branched-chain amino acid ABC transporter permease [Aquamicrobium defluvii]|nr:branched-chain amino acid ABC transporter permease [Aquamicrobium defluvii]